MSDERIDSDRSYGDISLKEFKSLYAELFYEKSKFIDDGKGDPAVSLWGEMDRVDKFIETLDLSKPEVKTAIIDNLYERASLCNDEVSNKLSRFRSYFEKLENIHHEHHRPLDQTNQITSLINCCKILIEEKIKSIHEINYDHIINDDDASFDKYKDKLKCDRIIVDDLKSFNSTFEAIDKNIPEYSSIINELAKDYATRAEKEVLDSIFWSIAVNREGENMAYSQERDKLQNSLITLTNEYASLSNKNIKTTLQNQDIAEEINNKITGLKNSISALEKAKIEKNYYQGSLEHEAHSKFDSEQKFEKFKQALAQIHTIINSQHIELAPQQVQIER